MSIAHVVVSQVNHFVRVGFRVDRFITDAVCVYMCMRLRFVSVCACVHTSGHMSHVNVWSCLPVVPLQVINVLFF